MTTPEQEYAQKRIDDETPEQRAERIFKEDDEKHERDDQQGLRDRQQKRHAVVEKHKEALDAMLLPRRGIQFRRYFVWFVRGTAIVPFATFDQEYDHIGKVGRKKWSDYEAHIKAFTKDELKVAGDIIHEFGAYDY
jgi:hypothetical protein